MRKITIIAAIAVALSTPAVAQVSVDTDNRVGQPSTPPKGGQPKGLITEVGMPALDAATNKAPATSPRDPASGRPTGKR